jgi:hypothetical protein
VETVVIDHRTTGKLWFWRRVDVIEFLLIARTLGADPVEIFAEIARSVAGGG